MLLFPAIDIRAGRVVRLSQGEAGRETSYHDDPVAQAERFLADGASWVHVVDLDRAFGTGENRASVAGIVKALAGRVSVQLGGGLRTLGALEEVIDLGVTRSVLGTAAITDPSLIGLAVARLGSERLGVGLDAKAGMVAIRGWVETTPLTALDAARRAVAEGARTLIYTDVARDGMLSGPDIEGAAALQGLGARVIASGGVSSLADLRAAKQAGLLGAIIGRALYERKFSLPEALAAVA